MEIIKANYKGYEHFARAENEVQQRYVVDSIKAMKKRVLEEITRIVELINSGLDVEELGYYKSRLEGLRDLDCRLGTAWGEVLGLFDDEVDS